MQKVTDRFRCLGDDGVTYEVIEKQDFIDATTKDGVEWIPGMKWAELPNGRKLNFVNDRTFRIVQTGVVVRRIG